MPERPNVADRAASDPRLRAMSRLVRRLSLGFTLVVALGYVALNLSALYASDWLASPVADGGLLSRGIVIAIGLILAALAATAIFVWIANSKLDRLRAEILEEPRS